VVKHLTLLAILFLQGAAPSAMRTIAGRILKTTGEPAAEVRVSAVAEDSVSGEKTGTVALMSLTQTDSAGRYRLEVPPGRYRILAGPLLTPTYFPGVTQSSEATAVVVTDRSTHENHDFEMALVNVSGRVSGSRTATDITEVILRFTLVDPFVEIQRVPIQADGSFLFPSVPSGSYTVVAGRSLLPVKVEKQDVTGLEFEAPAPNVKGRFIVEGGGPMPTGVTLTYTPAGASFAGADMRGSVQATSQPDGSFALTITRTRTGDHRIVLQKAVPSAYSIRSITLGNQDVLSSRATSIAVNGTMDVTFQSVGVRLQGRLTGADGPAVTDRRILLTGTTSVPGTFPAPVSRETAVDSDGRFVFTDIFRGRYEIRVQGEPSTVTPIEVGDEDVLGLSIPISK
jgi:hypothetical protein